MIPVFRTPDLPFHEYRNAPSIDPISRHPTGRHHPQALAGLLFEQASRSWPVPVCVSGQIHNGTLSTLPPSAHIAHRLQQHHDIHDTFATSASHLSNLTPRTETNQQCEILSDNPKRHLYNSNKIHLSSFHLILFVLCIIISSL